MDDTPGASGAGPAVAPLDRLAPGHPAWIDSVDARGPLGRRLLDLGLLPGTPIRVVRRAPLGDPVELEVRGTRLCLRRSEISRVRVRESP